MPDQRDDVLNFIKYNGPVLPVQIAKHINTNILFSSAILSELVARKILKITHASIGGSPLYYLPGQEDQMDAKLSTSLSGREKEAYQLLKDKKVLREVDMEPWQRVAVKSLKDFSVQLNVNIDGELSSFWKHQLVSDEEAKIIIADIMNDLVKQDVVVEENIPIEEQPVEQAEVNSVAEEIQEEVEDEPIVEEIKEKKVKLKEETIKEFEQPIKQKTVKKDKVDGLFYSKVFNFIKNHDVEVLKEEIVKKDKEMDFIVNIPSAFGKLKYLIKAKNKPSLNETDVSMAFSEGQIKKLPVILLINGKANKKAFLLVEQKMQGQLVLKEI